MRWLFALLAVLVAGVLGFMLGEKVGPGATAPLIDGPHPRGPGAGNARSSEPVLDAPPPVAAAAVPDSRSDAADLAAESREINAEQREELIRLRQEVGELQRQLAEAKVARGEMPDTIEGLKAAIRSLNPNLAENYRRRAVQENEYLREILRQFPDDPMAGQYLSDLSGNLISYDAEEALAVLDEFGSRVVLPPGRLESLRANALHFSGRGEESRAIYAQLSSDPRLTEAKQCEYAFWHAHALQRDGQYPAARQAYEALLARIGDDVPAELESIVGGIHNQMDMLPE